MVNKSWIFLVILHLMAGCQGKKELPAREDDSFVFVFMTDIHVQPEMRAAEGFRKAIETADQVNPDFILTGGDLVMDALGVNYERANTLYDLYLDAIGKIKVPVYNTLGNHEIFAIYDTTGQYIDHPEYGKKMYENRVAPRYYSFDHKGWHFMVLDGIEDTGNQGYIGYVDSAQVSWIKSDLTSISAQMPIAVSIHIPLITVETQLERGSLHPNGKSTVVGNSKEVLDLFEGFNLKLVMQGHLHCVEDLYAHGIHFVTCGAVSSGWWTGPYKEMEEGFAVFRIQGDRFTWEYVDFGWDAVTSD